MENNNNNINEDKFSLKEDISNLEQSNLPATDEKSTNENLNDSNINHGSENSDLDRLETKTNEKKTIKTNGMEELNQVFNENSNIDSLKQKKLEEFNNEVKKGKSKKKKFINLLFFLLNIAIIVGLLIYNLLNDSGTSSPFNFKEINPLFFVVYLGLIIITIVLDILIICDLIKKATGKFRFCLAFKSYSVMKYYDNITPMSVGGQPFMVSYLAHREVSGSNALSIPMKKFIIQQLSWSFVCLIGLIASFVLHLINNPIIYTFSIIGFVINFGMILFILFGSTSKKLVRGIAVLGLKLATKLHLVKNYNKNLKKVLTFINEYNAIMKEFSSNKLEFIKLLLISTIRLVLYFCIPFSIYCMFEAPTFELFYTFFVFTVMVDLASSCCPLPGGTGMNEITFSVLFSSYLPSQVFWALLLWRLASYYIWLILGLIILTYDFFVGNKRNKKLKQRHEIEKQNLENSQITNN